MKVYVVCYRREVGTTYKDTWEDMQEVSANIVGVTTTKEAAVELVIKFIGRELNRFEEYYGCLPDKFKVPADGRIMYEDCLNEVKYVEHVIEVDDGIFSYDEKHEWYVYIREFVTAD